MPAAETRVDAAGFAFQGRQAKADLAVLLWQSCFLKNSQFLCGKSVKTLKNHLSMSKAAKTAKTAKGVGVSGLSAYLKSKADGFGLHATAHRTYRL